MIDYEIQEKSIKLKRVSEYIGFESVDNNFMWVNKRQN